MTEALHPAPLKQIVVKDFEYRQNLRKDVKTFITYVERQAEYVNRSRDINSGIRGTKQNSKSKPMSSAGSSIVASTHERKDARKKG